MVMIGVSQSATCGGVVEQLRCEYLKDPVGIDTPQPRLSWVLEASQRSARDQRQSACEILVASSRQKLKAGDGDLWDSGKVGSEQSIQVRYAGRPLRSEQECLWKVRVWDQAGKPSGWSEPAQWSMGLLRPSDWHAKWIGLDEPAGNRTAKNVLGDAQWIWFPEGQPEKAAPVETRHFRHAIALPADRMVKRATLFFTADDSVDFFVNGQKTGTTGNFHSATETDVTKLLQAGANVLAASVKNGGASLLAGGELVAAAAAEEVLGPQAFPLATNIQQLRQLAVTERRILCSFRLEGAVCTASPAMDRLILQDDSGAELLELDLQGQRVSPGDRVRLEGEKSSVASAGPGLRIGREAVVDNDGIHGMRRRNGRVYLTAGRHPLRLVWFNAQDKYGLEVSYQGPALDHQRVPDSALFRIETDPATGLTKVVNGLDYRCYEGNWENLSAAFDHMKLVKTGRAPNFDLGVRTRDERVGLEFKGFLEVGREGLYTFETESDDGSRLFVTESTPRFERLGSAPLPPTRRLAVAQMVREGEEGQWTEVEGVVAFASEKDAGLELELRTETGRMEVVVADSSGLSPTLLMHSRVRAAGIGRSIHSMGGQRILGLLSVLSGADISRLEAAPGEADALPVLTTADQVKRLKREEAQRSYPVKIRGVITWARQPTIVIQDATRGIYVRGLPTQSPRAPEIGECWEIEGVTGPGTFAPLVDARQARRLGVGRLPEPVSATWDQLMHGSLDTQYVEIQGIVTAVEPNRLELLLKEGKINLNFPDLQPGTLGRYQNALIRVRGCLFPAWSRETHQVNVGEMSICNTAINVDEPAPIDVFSAPRKQVTELFLFDLGAGAFQRVKVAGQILCARGGQCFMMDGTNGLRFAPKEAAGLAVGDLAEVVGFPELVGPSPVLREAVARKTGHAELPEPTTLLPTNLLSQNHDATRVKVRGVLLDRHRERTEQVLEVQIGLRTVLARLKDPDGSVRALRLGSRLELTGIYAGQGGNRALGRDIDSFELLLNSPADLRVLARPPWWTFPRVLAAFGVVALVLAGVMLWAFSLRCQVTAQTQVIRQKAQREATLEERTRIAKDIHDDLGSSLTRIMMLGERIHEGLPGTDDAGTHTRKIVTFARAAVQSLNETVWAVNPENDTLDGLIGYISQYVGRLFEGTNVICRLEMPVAPSTAMLSAELRHNLFLVVKEALHNVLKHARASEVHVRVAETAASVEIVIADNGRGFNAAEVRARGQGNGLGNICQRLEQSGGRFSLSTAPGQGTKLAFTVPLNA